MTARLERLFAADLPTLPESTRRVLLLASAAGTERLSDVLHAAPGLDGVQVWRPAEEAGLVRVEGGQVRLRHPLVRSAIYQAASFAERREAHLALAAAFAKEPDRRAWHLAAAALGPDEQVATALADSAERSRQRGGHAAAAAALERAAELTPEPERRARRLLGAAASAMFAGHPQWVGDIATRVNTLTDDARLLAEASLRAGWSLAVTLRHDDSLAFLLHVAEAMATQDPALALDALGTAATPAYNSGDPFYRAELQRIDALIAPQPDEDGSDRLWVAAVGNPFTARERALERLTRAVDTLPDGSLSALVVLGAAATVLDATDLAVRLYGQAMDHLRRTATAGTNATLARALALALFDSGAWTAAQSAAEDAFWMATEAGADNVTVGAQLLQATLRAAQGDHAAAHARASGAWAASICASHGACTCVTVRHAGRRSSRRAITSRRTSSYAGPSPATSTQNPCTTTSPCTASPISPRPPSAPGRWPTPASCCTPPNGPWGRPVPPVWTRSCTAPRPCWATPTRRKPTSARRRTRSPPPGRSSTPSPT
ncbi:hypothetical protein [Streptomyces coeruleorubidus]|uniref:hypothetical protein n=1 Tax=Streptomyces coeruleorubidus TaxID=116188 RepID=UPI0037BAFF88